MLSEGGKNGLNSQSAKPVRPEVLPLYVVGSRRVAGRLNFPSEGVIPTSRAFKPANLAWKLVHDTRKIRFGSLVSSVAQGKLFPPPEKRLRSG